MRLLDRFREQEIMRVNDLALRHHPVGSEFAGFRVTRHKAYPTEPWATFVIYGVPVDEREQAA